MTIAIEDSVKQSNRSEESLGEHLKGLTGGRYIPGLSVQMGVIEEFYIDGMSESITKDQLTGAISAFYKDKGYEHMVGGTSAIIPTFDRDDRRLMINLTFRKDDYKPVPSCRVSVVKIRGE